MSGIFDDLDKTGGGRREPDRPKRTAEEDAALRRLYPSLDDSGGHQIGDIYIDENGVRRYSLTEAQQAAKEEQEEAFRQIREATETEDEQIAREERELAERKEKIRKIAMYPSLADAYDSEGNYLPPNKRGQKE